MSFPVESYEEDLEFIGLNELNECVWFKFI